MLARLPGLGFLPLLLLLLGVLPAPCGGADDADADALQALRRGLEADEPAARTAAADAAARLAGALPGGPAERRGAAAQGARRRGRTPRREALVRALARRGGMTGWVPVILAGLRGRDEARARRAPGPPVGRRATTWRSSRASSRRTRTRRSGPTSCSSSATGAAPTPCPSSSSGLEGEHPRVRSAAAGGAGGGDRAGLRLRREGLGRLVGRRGGPPSPRPAARARRRDGHHRRPRGGRREPPPHVSRSLVPDFYGLEIRSKDVVFVLDISGSVGTGRAWPAPSGAGRGGRTPRLRRDVSALFFDEEVRMWKPEMVRATPGEQGGPRAVPARDRAGRRTDVLTPLNAGLQILRRRLEEKDAAGEPVREAVTLIVVSDGVETAHQTPPASSPTSWTSSTPRARVVHAVVIGGKPSPLLFDLARRGGRALRRGALTRGRRSRVAWRQQPSRSSGGVSGRAARAAISSGPPATRGGTRPPRRARERPAPGPRATAEDARPRPPVRRATASRKRSGGDRRLVVPRPASAGAPRRSPRPWVGGGEPESRVERRRAAAAASAAEAGQVLDDERPEHLGTSGAAPGHEVREVPDTRPRP